MVVPVPHRYFMQLFEPIYYYTYNFTIAKLFLEDGEAWIVKIDLFFYSKQFFQIQRYRNLSFFFVNLVSGFEFNEYRMQYEFTTPPWVWI
jgi:hypothetical protein